MQENVQQKPVKGRALGALVTLLVLACLTCTGFLGYYVFQVQTIEVKGNLLFHTDEVIALSGVHKGDNLFAISSDKVREGLSSQPFLSLVGVQRKWPSTIVIDISERKAVGAIVYDGKYILVADDATALKIQSDAPEGYLIVEGMGVTAASVGAKIQGATEYQIHVLSLIAARIEKSSCKKSIASVNLRDPAAMTLKTGCGITIRIGTEENLDMKFSWVETLLPRLIDEGKSYGTLDVTGSSGASYVP